MSPPPSGSRGEAPAPEYIIRVTLPNPDSFPPTPDGSREYELHYWRAIREAMPPDFDIIPLRSNEKWDKDSRGRAIIPIGSAYSSTPLNNYVKHTKDAFRRMEDIIRSIRIDLNSFESHIEYARRKMPARQSTAGEPMMCSIQSAAAEHNEWVEAGGLRSGDPGPLDQLIASLEEALEMAKREKKKKEEE